MEGRKLTARIESCFLTGVDSTKTIVHALKVFNLVDGNIDEVFISDFAFKTVCQSSDEEAAKLWAAHKESLSAGYTDEAFIYMMKSELSKLDYELCRADVDDGLALIALYNFEVMPGFDYSLMWRTKPLVKKRQLMVAEKSRSIRHLDLLRASWFNENMTVYKAGQPTSYEECGRVANFATSIAQLTNPIDQVLQSGTIVGYELLRRLLL